MPEYLVIEVLVLAIAIGLWFENRRHMPKSPPDSPPPTPGATDPPPE